MVEYSICKTWCFSQYAPRRQSWSGSVGKVDGSLPSRRWAGSSPDHSFDLVILITITKMTIIKQWCEDLLGVAYFTKYPKSLHPLDSECCLTAVILPSNLSYSHKYRAYSYLLKTQIHTNMGHVPIFSKLKTSDIIFPGKLLYLFSQCG